MTTFNDGWSNGPLNGPGNEAGHAPLGEPIEQQITQWRTYLRRRKAVHGPDVMELESHLRDQLAELMEDGLRPDEALLVAVKRMGGLDDLSREFAREHSERLWKQLVLTPDSNDAPGEATRTESLIVLGLATAAGLAVKLPNLFRNQFQNDQESSFYIRNASLLVFPVLALYFLWKRKAETISGLWLALPFLAGALIINVFPFRSAGETEILAAIHLPIVLWLVVGFAYVRSQWFAGNGRMDFVRFSGELFIYYVLIALGGGVFVAFTMMLFRSIGMNATPLIGEWLIPCGAAGAVIIGSWLVEAKQSVIESMAPVLTRLFTPLFTALFLGFLVTMVWTRSLIHVERQVLIGFDLLLVIVVGLVLYAVSSRDPQSAPNLFDRLQLVLIVSALAVDAVALVVIASRISAFGFSANRVAALGENLILLVNLTRSAWLYAGFLRKRNLFSALERWQVIYIPVYAVWAALVVIAFPPIFHYR